jgi:hypothetical protein
LLEKHHHHSHHLLEFKAIISLQSGAVWTGMSRWHSSSVAW